MTDNNKRTSTFTRKKLPHYIRLASGASLLAMGAAMPAFAQDSEADDAALEEVVVTGQRLSIMSAQDIKRDADQIVDSIVASDIGKLPDRSVTEALQRIPGVSITHFKSLGDPEHFSAEGSGVMVRGLTMVRSELNGRDSFTADGGRALSFQDVPPELMAGVDVYKNQSADLVEGGLGGTVNLRTKKPFDYDEMELSFTAEGNYGDFVEKTSPSGSALFSNRWAAGEGEIGVLLDFAYSEAATRTDGVYTRALFPREDLVPGETVYVPRGADWRSYEFDRERQGAYGVVQWRVNDTTEMHLQVFNSQYKEFWDESSIFVDNWPYDIVPAAGTEFTYDENGIFREGELASVTGGIPMGAATRFQDRQSETTDISYNLKWNPNDKWDLSFDLQHVMADTKSLDATVATGVQLDSLYVDLTGDRPQMRTDADYLSDPANYYMAFTMDNRTDNEAEETALRLDAEYKFDSEVLRSTKFGVRFTDTSSENHDTGYDWQPIYQQWMRWWAVDGMAPLPRANADQLSLNTLDNFYRGDGVHPGVFMTPNISLASGFPQTFLDLHQEAADSGNYLCCYGPISVRDINDDAYSNLQDENTSAIYGVTYFGWDDLKYPVSGNVGVRVVKTEMSTEGNTIYPTAITDLDGNQGFYREAQPLAVDNSYTNVLPSLNLKMELNDELQLRFAAARAMSRPAFGDLQAYQVLSADLPEGTELADGPSLEDFILTADLFDNPKLDPTLADQYDLSLEWYFDDAGGMAHINLFYKDITDLVSREFVQEEYNGWSYSVARPTNNGEGKLQGAEVGLKKFFDQLPEPFNGLGIDATYTYIDSEMNLEDISQPVDTDFSSYAELPFTGISRDSYNFTAMYEWGPISARLAYNWRSKFLMGVGQNGFNGDTNGQWRLPVYNDDYGQLDASIEYRFNESVAFSLQAINIGNAETVLIADQNAAGDHKSSYVNDTTYIGRVSVNF
ncbi:TonB-dependent receptor [Microbulbifer rhizosphaerae]|uniref:TonB-dependent receptor n=1 Tax=Microbulbifer rhizosphaerae TaxID=1562603 RepID=A0A7W4WE08_9GAMM|nr:TonB-dependent receptor [Microbulbifer rhizosphaerae]MBB3062520.1 TonB-dependent receptor [Microbulbifer rhizosphaerae]